MGVAAANLADDMRGTPLSPLITPIRPLLALQLSADHLLRALRLCLPVRSYRHLLLLGRRQHRRARHPAEDSPAQRVVEGDAARGQRAVAGATSPGASQAG